MILFLTAIAFMMTVQISHDIGQIYRHGGILRHVRMMGARPALDRLVMNHRMFAVMPDGTRHRVTARQLATDYWRFERLIVPAVVRGDRDRLATSLHQIRTLYPAAHRIELIDDPILILIFRGSKAAQRRIVASLDISQGLGR
jgi:hypothetical protein